VAIAITIRMNTYVAWGTDSSAYVDGAAQWAAGDLFHPAPFMSWAPWARDGNAEAPFGRVAGAIRGTLVNVYPPGYSLLLAAALEIGGPLAPHVVSPIFLGVLAWCAYLLASQVSTRWAGVFASLLIAATPVAVAHVLMPMSDVPAAALWALAWVLALRPGLGAPLASGLCVAMAVLVRPNLAPIGIAIAAVVVAARWRAGERVWIRLLIFLVASAIGPAILMWTQNVLYGSPFKTGYVAADTFFRLERIPANIVHYPRLLIDLYGWLVLSGLALVPFAFRLPPSNDSDVPPWVVVFGAVGILLANYAVLLPYLTFEGWYWLRFLLPGLLALFVLFAAALDRIRVLVAARSRILQFAALVPLALVVRAPQHEMDATFESVATYARVSMMGAYLKEALPPNAVILAYLQSGAAAFYTGLPVLRLDAIAPESLDKVIDDLARTRQRPVLIVDEAMEAPSLRERFAGSRYQKLDWPPRAEFWSSTPMLYMDPADREAYLNAEGYPNDILKTPADYPYPKSSAAAAPPHGVAMPGAYEASAFRTALDSLYRHHLGRPAGESHVRGDDAVRYTLRYLRYRLYACSHDQAVANVFTQIDRHDVPPVCGRVKALVFPPWDQVVDFRRRLEAKYRDQLRTGPSRTFVDLEGDAIWTQEYLRYRVGSCSPDEATARVFDRIAGKPEPATCRTSSLP
jgi:hypothetical protein